MRLLIAIRTLLRFVVVRARRADSSRAIILGYLCYVFVGTLFLALPFCRVNHAGGWLDWLFVSASAVSTTGLSTMSTGNDFTLVGQIAILWLIQLGGLGYMTTGSFILLSVSGRMNRRREKTQRMVLNLPESVGLETIVRLILVYTLLVEAAGAVVLYRLFDAAGVPGALWSAIFHSVSSFCTAGFGLYDDSLSSFKDNIPVNAVICTLSILGSMGFLIVHDLWKTIVGLKINVAQTTRIIVLSTAIMICLGCVLVRAEEPLTNGGYGWTAAFFQVVSACTTVGFNTLPMDQLSNATTFILIVLMLVGASPAGTGGGIKTTTVTALWAVMASVIRRSPEPTFAGKIIPEARRRIAVATTYFYVLMLCAGIYLLSAFQPGDLTDIVFECASALGTVGLSLGLTAHLNGAGMLVIIFLMVVGRIGPLLLASALFTKPSEEQPPANEEDVIV
jgi:trk system potassium uptake protein TrkH